MTRLILRFLNGPALVLLIALGVGIQTSLFAAWPLNYFQPDVVLIAVIWCALRRSFTEGGVLTLILADIAELHSASPQGLYLITYMVIYLAVRVCSRIFVIPNLSSFVLVTLFSSVAWKIAGLGVLHLLGTSANQWRHTLLLLFPGAVVEGVLSWWAFRWLEKFDWVTFKTARAQTEIEEELQLEPETLG